MGFSWNIWKSSGSQAVRLPLTGWQKPSLSWGIGAEGHSTLGVEEEARAVSEAGSEPTVGKDRSRVSRSWRLRAGRLGRPRGTVEEGEPCVSAVPWASGGQARDRKA